MSYCCFSCLLRGMFRFSLPTVTLTGTALLLTATSSRAAGNLYSNFGSGDTYNMSGGYFTSGPTSGTGSIVQAMSFVATATGTVTSVDLALSPNTATPTVIVGLVTNSASNLPGTISLFSASGTVPTGSIYNFTSTASPLLTVGATYWMTVAAQGNGSVNWLGNSIGATGSTAISNDNGATYHSNGTNSTITAFRINAVGAATPEPGTLELLIPAIGCLGLAKRKSRRIAP